MYRTKSSKLPNEKEDSSAEPQHLSNLKMEVSSEPIEQVNEQFSKNFFEQLYDITFADQ